MFKKRALQINVVKKNAQTTPDNPEKDLSENLEIVSDAAERMIMKVGVVVAAYVVLDTVRQVIVKAVDQ